MRTFEDRWQRRYERFRAHHTRARGWICFAEVVDWYVEFQASKRTVEPFSEQRSRSRAYDLLVDDTQEGFFCREGRSRILFANPDSQLCRVTTEVLEGALTISMLPSGQTDTEIIRSAYLDHWWISRRDFVRWLKKHHLPNLPPRFEGQISATVSTVGLETRAATAFAELLKKQPSLKRKDGRRWVTTTFEITGRGFDRVWPRARELAGLPRRASSGRKPAK